MPAVDEQAEQAGLSSMNPICKVKKRPASLAT